MKLYISFHGGKHALNNIHGYDLSDPSAKSTKLLPDIPERQELRGFAVQGSKLYVVDAYKKLNQLLAYDLSGLKKSPPANGSVLASGETINSVFHPFDLAFDGNGNIYLSSQDSNVVTRMTLQGTAQHVASYLTGQYPNGGFLSGTFIASDTGKLDGISSPYPPNVPSRQGLSVSVTDGEVQNSVRGVLVNGDYLYVADEVANSVNAYNLSDGSLIGYLASDSMSSPVHLKANNNQLYIGAGSSIFSYDLSNGAPEGEVAPDVFIDGGLHHASGMAFDSLGNFYVAQRKKKNVLQYDSSGTLIGEVLTGLNDNPEFIEFLDI
ncbi:MAG: hypothetical protein HEP71_00325 [Roseivirga sp.]|nr:hypothetical protein [Roseivirga sp.]